MRFTLLELEALYNMVDAKVKFLESKNLTDINFYREMLELKDKLDIKIINAQ